MTKRIVYAFDGHITKIDPRFCDHHNTYLVTEHGDSWLVCPDCKSIIDDDGNVVTTAEDEIPF